MNALEMLEENPRATEAIREYYLELMINSLDQSSLPENFKDFMREQGLNNDKVAEMIESNPRNLFDIFDHNDLFISITYDTKFKKFHCYINDDKHKFVESTRKEIDYQAFKIALGRLEEKLNPQPSAEVYED